MSRTTMSTLARVLLATAVAVLALAGRGVDAASGLRPVMRKAAVPAATVGQAYRYDLAKVFECPTNPAPVFAFTWSNPTQVPGLPYPPSGLISGTPTAAGTYSQSFQVTDISTAPGACTGVSTDNLTLTVNPAPASQVAPVGNTNNQVVPPNTAVPLPLTARLVDSGGNPVAGAAVTWTVTSGSGTVTTPTLVSNAQGLVQAGFTSGASAQSATITVAAVGSSAAFQFTVLSQQAAVDAPSQEVTTPAVATALSTPSIQIANIRQRLDQIRFQHSPAVARALRVKIDGQALVPMSAFALASAPARDAKGPTGGGASAEQRPRGGGAAADSPDPFGRWGFFVNGDIDIGKQSAVETQAAFKLTSNGLTLGSDYRFEGNHVLGAALGLLKAETSVADGGSQDAKGYSLSLYGSYVPIENAYLDGIVNVGRNTYDSQRQQGVGGIATSSTDGNQFALAVSAGWNFNQGPITANPYLRAEYVDAKINGFTESGDANEALSVSEQRVKVTTLAVGGQVSYAASTSWGVLVPYGKLELQYLAQSSAQNVSAQLANSGSNPSIVPKLGQDKTYGTFAAGASAILANGFSCFFNYEQLFGKENFKDQKYTLGLRLEF